MQVREKIDNNKLINSKKKGNVEKEEIKTAILKRYHSLSAFAEKNGITSTQLSKWLNKPTLRFRALLENEGILISREEKKKVEEDMENTSEIVNGLKKIVEEKNIIIQEQGKLLQSKDKMIEQLERFIELQNKSKK